MIRELVDMIMMIAIRRQGHRALGRLASLVCCLRFFDFPVDWAMRALKIAEITCPAGSFEVCETLL